MTELKTLKDLRKMDMSVRFEYGGKKQKIGNAFVNSWELKKEAIKWVKEFRSLTKFFQRQIGKNTAAGVCYGLIQFFNLTEEDLK